MRPQPERPQVAFSATMDENMPRTVKYRVVKFSIILTNIGAAYDPENGIFTTPVNGTYVIGFTGVSYHGQVHSKLQSYKRCRFIFVETGFFKIAICISIMQRTVLVNQKITHPGKGLSKCAPFRGNVHIFMEICENVCILTEMHTFQKCVHFHENAIKYLIFNQMCHLV